MPCHLGPPLRLWHPMICSPSELTFSESKKQAAETQIRRAGACWQLCGLQGVWVTEEPPNTGPCRMCSWPTAVGAVEDPGFGDQAELGEHWLCHQLSDLGK